MCTLAIYNSGVSDTELQRAVAHAMDRYQTQNHSTRRYRAWPRVTAGGGTCLRCGVPRRHSIDGIRKLAHISHNRKWRRGAVSQTDLESVYSIDSLHF